MRLQLAKFPLRSLLFVPGINTRMIEKSWSTGADAIIFDLEDSVVEQSKPDARKNVQNALETASEKSAYTLVRINACITPYWKDDIKAVVGKNLQGIVIPKCDSVRALAEISEVVRQCEQKLGMQVGSTMLFLLIESARGLIDAPLLLASSHRVAGLLFGAEDFCLNLGITPQESGNELLYARSHLVTCARAYDSVAVDSVRTNIHDSEGLRREAEASRRIGFVGKLAIHPRQVDVLNAAFTPSDEELASAQQIVAAFATPREKGTGVAVLNGQMVDSPVVARAKQVIGMWELSRRRPKV